jgi:hypothetical protein
MKKTLITLSALLLIGCSARKVNKTEAKENTEITQTVKEESKTDITENTEVIDTSTTDEIELIPIDNTQPIIYNGKKVYNAKIRHKKQKNNITTNKEKKVAKNENREVKTDIETNKKEFNKQTEKQSSFNWLWILFILFLILLAWWKWKKYFR